MIQYYLVKIYLTVHIYLVAYDLRRHQDTISRRRRSLLHLKWLLTEGRRRSPTVVAITAAAATRIRAVAAAAAPATAATPSPDHEDIIVAAVAAGAVPHRWSFIAMLPSPSRCRRRLLRTAMPPSPPRASLLHPLPSLPSGHLPTSAMNLPFPVTLLLPEPLWCSTSRQSSSALAMRSPPQTSPFIFPIALPAPPLAPLHDHPPPDSPANSPVPLPDFPSTLSSPSPLPDPLCKIPFLSPPFPSHDLALSSRLDRDCNPRPSRFLPHHETIPFTFSRCQSASSRLYTAG